MRRSFSCNITIPSFRFPHDKRKQNEGLPSSARNTLFIAVYHYSWDAGYVGVLGP